MAPSVSERGAADARLADPQADAAGRRRQAARRPRLSPQHRPARPRDARRACAAKLASAPTSVLAYTPSAGTPECLDALAQYYRRLGIDARRRRAGGHHGRQRGDPLRAARRAPAEGDEALVVEPFYTNYQAFATMAGVRLRALVRRGEDGFHLPPREAWEAALTPRTRLVLLCNPEQPDRHRLLAGGARSAWRSSAATTACSWSADEVYREFVYDGQQATSAALARRASRRLVVVVDSLSKRYSACGIRLGCLATRNRDVLSARACAWRRARLSPPGLAQLVALGCPELRRRLRAGHRAPSTRRGATCSSRGSRDIPGVFLRKPEGAFYFVARLPVDDATTSRAGCSPTSATRAPP